MRDPKFLGNVLKHVLAIDSQLTDALSQWARHQHIRKVARLLSRSADSWVWLGGAFLMGLLIPPWRCLAWVGGGGVFSLAAFIYVLKALIRRQRPRPESGWIYAMTDDHSFPSGHAARAVLLVMLTLPIGRPIISLGVALWAIMVSFSRLTLGVHYISDVLAGMILGGGWGGMVLAFWPGVQSICSAWGF